LQDRAARKLELFPPLRLQGFRRSVTCLLIMASFVFPPNDIELVTFCFGPNQISCSAILGNGLPLP
jgi:hypothetical protein